LDRCVPPWLKIVTSVGVVDAATVIVKGSSFETVLSGLSTKTFAVATPVVGSKALAGKLMYFVGIDAVNCVLEPNVVVRATPFHITLLPLTKLAPVAVRVNALGIALVDVLGEIAVSVGAGPRPPAMTVSGSVLVFDLSGLVTPAVIVAAAATLDAGIVA
jgi:hypothetical protein